MTDVEALTAEGVRMVEAMLAREAARERTRLAARLRGPLRTWWQAQGRRFLRELSRHSQQFTEAPTQRQWDAAWTRAADGTSSDMVTVMQRHAERSLAAGAAHTIAEVGIETDFDLGNPRASRFLRNRGADRVRAINDETRSQMRTVLAQATDEGWSWQRTGSRIRSQFDGFSGRGPMGRHLRDRAELVAVNETAEAYAEGNDIIRRDLAGQGLNVEKQWVDSGDERVTPECQSNSGAGWIAHGDVFPSGAAHEPRFPGCRCVTTTRTRE